MMVKFKKIYASKWTHWFLTLLALFLLVDELVFTNGTMRYRMTVRIDTPEGIKTGSAVREIFMSQGIALTPESHAVLRLKGDVVVVDLGKRGKVFALLKGYFIDADNLIFLTFGRPGYPNGGGALTREGIRFYRSLDEGKVVLKPNYYPYLVRFKDFNDPQSIESVMGYTENPMPFANKLKLHNFIDVDHFEEMFGAGVKIKDITIEMTNDAVTHDTSQWPEWMRVPMGKHLNNNILPDYELKYELTFTKYEFTRGF